MCIYIRERLRRGFSSAYMEILEGEEHVNVCDSGAPIVVPLVCWKVGLVNSGKKRQCCNVGV